MEGDLSAIQIGGQEQRDADVRQEGGLDRRDSGCEPHHRMGGWPELPPAQSASSHDLPGSQPNSAGRSASGVVCRSSLVEGVPRSATPVSDPNRPEEQLQPAFGCRAHQCGPSPAWHYTFQPVSPSLSQSRFQRRKNDENIKFNIFSLAADASFQLDFFGRFRRATEAARAQLLGAEDAQETVILTLVSDVASDYFQLRNLDLQLQVAEDTVKTQEKSVNLTKLRLKHGVATRLDVLQARQVLDAANAQVPDLERQIGQTEDALSILLGNYPQGIPRGRPLGTETPQGWVWTEILPPQLPPGLPSALLERRPDIRQAEQNLIAANADVGVAKAMFFPQVSLLGSGGGAWGHTVFFGTSVPAHMGVYSYEARLAQPLFEGGYLRNNLRNAKSQYRQALISYKQTIQQAFGDVSDALIGYQKYHQARLRQEESVKDLQESVRVSMMRYRGGTATYLDVLDSQRSLFSAELTLAQARNNEYQSLVQLYKALGGGWQQ